MLVDFGELYGWKPSEVISGRVSALGARASFGARTPWRGNLDFRRMARLFSARTAVPPVAKPSVGAP